MPHVSVRMYAGRTEEDKQRLAEAIGQALIQTLGSSERSISITIEDVAADGALPASAVREEDEEPQAGSTEQPRQHTAQYLLGKYL